MRTLPPVVVLPLDDVDALGPALDLLFAEIDNVRCGSRVLADRLFEVVLIQLYRWILGHADELSQWRITAPGPQRRNRTAAGAATTPTVTRLSEAPRAGLRKGLA